ncbi:hypothetical protein Mal4_46580 [Maioricimonas rarisocia]|uniref:Uncharacterized protein n=1 Tax=Maioricimonas rarisocia TaxID=2528026 RepID=A0A517ZCX0_9PLAN|nr:hypothetical protein [Maioricimonas rarisocia]QDU40302.1 hypothetical protein Mal4_46580 [Maioricimonas rarisocia]
MQFREAIAIITGGRRESLRPAALAVGSAGTRIVVCPPDVDAGSSPVAAAIDALVRLLAASTTSIGPAQPAPRAADHR